MYLEKGDIRELKELFTYFDGSDDLETLLDVADDSSVEIGFVVGIVGNLMNHERRTKYLSSYDPRTVPEGILDMIYELKTQDKKILNWGCGRRRLNLPQAMNLDPMEGHLLASLAGKDKMDVILLRHVLHHAPNPYRTLESCSQLMSKDSYLLIIDHNVDRDKLTKMNIWHKALDYRFQSVSLFYSFMSFFGLKKLLKRLNLQAVEFWAGSFKEKIQEKEIYKLPFPYTYSVLIKKRDLGEIVKKSSHNRSRSRRGRNKDNYDSDEDFSSDDSELEYEEYRKNRRGRSRSRARSKSRGRHEREYYKGSSERGRGRGRGRKGKR